MLKILIVDDEAPIREVMSAALMDEGFEVKTAHDGESGLEMIRDFRPDVSFLDIWMPGSIDGIELLQRARKDFPQAEYVMISGHGTIETAVKATKIGAWDFIEKPLSMDKISIVISNIQSFMQEREEKSALLNKLRRSVALIGESQEMKNVKQKVAQFAENVKPVLLVGESGVGKSLISQNIHYMGSRAGKTFVEINCMNIPEDLIEVEIFGAEKGSLPGLDKGQKGKLELADNGTLFIKEVDLIPLPVQAALFHYMQTGEFKRFGSTAILKADVRLILSSTQNEGEVSMGYQLREDLRFVLNNQSLVIAPLRLHPEDIPSLISAFSDHFCRESGESRKVFSEKSLEVMQSYPWSGNVRELKNFVERVYILTPGEFVDVHDVKFAGLSESSSATDMRTFREARAQFEKEYLTKKISENGGNISRTAEMIGLERSYLHRKIKAYGIEVNS
ncbi:MAG: sigma-54 dependent transcriptional regulator [Bdellovibrionota bacterium]